ncbi:helix-turn-helix domain-containing protein [Brevibacillus brevis]|uniref:helix-turn-helix domain-containing protein n=1 Tax=Brevibacillus brevis TaxID=1393 RepID=UPI0037C8A15E
MPSLLTIVGERIRFLRKNRGLTQEQLGEKVGLPQSYIGGIERGEKNVSLETLERIIYALDVNPEEIFKSGMDKEKLQKDQLIDKITLKLEDRDSTEIKTIHNLVNDVIKAFDSPRKSK